MAILLNLVKSYGVDVFVLTCLSSTYIACPGLEIRVDRWPESTKNQVGPPIQVRQWSGGLPKLCQRTLHLLAFFYICRGSDCYNVICI